MGYKDMKDKAIAEKTANVIKAKFIKMDEEGTEIVGRYINRGAIEPTNGGKEYGKYTFDTDDGIIMFAPGGVFDNNEGATMQVGKVYSVTYLGKEKTSGTRQMNTFEVLEIGE